MEVVESGFFVWTQQAGSSSDQNSWKLRKQGGLKGQSWTETCLKLPTFDWKKETPKDLLVVVLLLKDWKECCEHVRNSVESRQEAHRPITFQLKIATANKNLHLAQCLLKENVFRKVGNIFQNKNKNIPKQTLKTSQPKKAANLWGKQIYKDTNLDWLRPRRIQI